MCVCVTVYMSVSMCIDVRMCVGYACLSELGRPVLPSRLSLVNGKLTLETLPPISPDIHTHSVILTHKQLNTQRHTHADIYIQAPYPSLSQPCFTYHKRTHRHTHTHTHTHTLKHTHTLLQKGTLNHFLSQVASLEPTNATDTKQRQATSASVNSISPSCADTTGGRTG